MVGDGTLDSVTAVTIRLNGQQGSVLFNPANPTLITQIMVAGILFSVTFVDVD